jgi:imidazolonepropionase-like amidohydrolase
VRKSVDLGTLQPGKSADLLMLPRNPLEDIRNLGGHVPEMRAGEWLTPYEPPH